VKLPICLKDLKSNSLCEKCSEIVRKKNFSSLDLEMCRLLFKLEERFFPFNVEYVKSIDLGEIVVLIGKGKIGALIGKSGRIVRELSKEMKKIVRIIEFTSDEKKMVQDLAGRARVIGLNRIFEENNEKVRVIIPKSDESKLITSKESIEKGIQELLKAETRIEFV
jgi:transcription antitermination factor NusA-like protein